MGAGASARWSKSLVSDKEAIMKTASIPVLSSLSLLMLALPTQAGDVQVIGEMRRMFTAHDIGANVSLARVNANPHLYALGPIAGLRGEITAWNGDVFTSQVIGNRPNVTINPETKAVFLVYAFVSAWRTIDIPAGVSTESDLAAFVDKQLTRNVRSVFLIKGLARSARYHIQNYQGAAQDLTHELHEQAKVFFDLTNAPVELVGFFTKQEGDGGSFVHMGQTTHIHLLSKDRQHMGHLESIQLSPGAKLLLPPQ